MQRDDSLLLDMLQAARQIREYTSGLQELDFLNSRRDQDAVLLQCTVLGETAKRVSSEFRNAHPEIPWRKIMGFRNVVVHDYFQVDVHRAWKIASRPPLSAHSSHSGDRRSCSPRAFAVPRKAPRKSRGMPLRACGARLCMITWM